MTQQIPLSPDNEVGADVGEGVLEVLPDVAYERLLLVNVAYVGVAGSPDWVLIDAGLPGMSGRIVAAAESRFGAGAKPRAIVMTHAHFDHAGSLETLAARWDVPIYAHPLELPYLDGGASYPPPDTSVGGGVMSLSAGLFPRSPVNVSNWLVPLPDDGSVPPLPGWRWLHTPGHSVGHVSLWREGDRTLLAGDAFITTAQESAYAVATQAAEMHGPPMYFTQDWAAAKASVERLATLEPEVAITGHGRAMHGAEMRAALHTLAREFDSVARPRDPKYLREPARAEDGSAYKPA